MKVGLLVEGGSMAPGPALAQKLGPLGINIGQVISKVNDATKDFKGMKVPVDLDIDVSTKQFTISIKSPPVPELLKKEAGIDKGTGEHKKLQVANISVEQVIKVAKTKLPDMLEKDLKAAVKTVVGSCVSLGIMIENLSAVEFAGKVSDGEYDKEIKAGKTETSEAKKKELQEFFSQLHKKQEAKLQQEKAEEEAAKAEKATAPAPVAEIAEKTAAPAKTAKPTTKPAGKK
ncbi:50S ribosomal protein L11 [Candidatus Pacearchaeota archaeon CG10_big_fil_rev_8_21_14_0_10_31_9]|nr:MAG: 50S ribosomal protein L11 [Candidatus Pacearchaeota archaeon CG1_02_32_21]PIN94226.1 MAG: 50S ribosomal protein L11 [Candidatus Pacearchaeota archaeon CG10_big_fil_rev_8_21_14_0_10_31_9]PIZ82991.1 MAG: 50S ribosomal protein L11 [Candidatus Pacearchaeota archaeon CG_4_10_14_0_2_um_filter_05_32_18]